jgi:hypothetical protein
MKRILLTTTALTMTAGIAAAEVSVSGSFKLGFNDTDSNAAAIGTAGSLGTLSAAGVYTAGSSAVGYTAAETHDNNYGVYNDAGITFAMSSTMDNGMAVSATVDMNGGDTVNNATDSYTLGLASDGLNVAFGSTEYSARSAWKSAGSMATDGWFNQNDAGGNVLKASANLGGLAVSASSLVTTGAKASPNAVSISVAGSVGGATYVIANEGSMMGVSVGTALGGASVTSAYSTDGTDTSTGVKISYPAGAITTTASYVVESAVATIDAWDLSAKYSAGGSTVTVSTDEGSDNKIEGSTTLGGATVNLGLTDKLEDMYLAVKNPLGGGASIMASYAVEGTGADGTDGLDEIGGPDYQEGLTVELSFTF